MIRRNKIVRRMVKLVFALLLPVSLIGCAPDSYKEVVIGQASIDCGIDAKKIKFLNCVSPLTEHSIKLCAVMITNQKEVYLCTDTNGCNPISCQRIIK